MKRILLPVFAATMLLSLASNSHAQQTESVILLSNANVFDGSNETLLEDTDVLIVGNIITRIAQDIDDPDGATIIDAAGRTLMPGLIDAHYHLMLAASEGDAWRLEQPDYTHAKRVVESNELLQRGFTSIRDTTGPGFGIKKAVDEWLIPGPRMYLSGTLISQTSGHADRTLPF